MDGVIIVQDKNKEEAAVAYDIFPRRLREGRPIAGTPSKCEAIDAARSGANLKNKSGLPSVMFGVFRV